MSFLLEDIGFRGALISNDDWHISYRKAAFFFPVFLPEQEVLF
jgi:hypothetical protein